MSEQGLFRIEVVKFLANNDGRVILAQPVTVKLGTALIVVFTLLWLAFTMVAPFSKRETVRGVLVPGSESTAITSPMHGVVNQLLVADGDAVQAGQALALVASAVSTQHGDVRLQKLTQLERQKALIVEQYETNSRLARSERRGLETRLHGLDAQIRQISDEIGVRAEQADVARGLETKLKELKKSGFVSEPQYAENYIDLLERQSLVSTLRRELERLQSERDEARRVVSQFDDRDQALRTERDQALFAIEREALGLAADREVVLRADVAGTMWMASAIQGRAVSAGETVFHVIPAGAKMKAQLLIPGRVLPFVQKGGTVRLRVDGFPYQRFGYLSAQVDDIYNAPVQAASRLDGGASGSSDTKQLVYAALQNEVFQVDGKPVHVRPGMSFDADIMLERKTLAEWFFEPILSVRARW